MTKLSNIIVGLFLCLVGVIIGGYYGFLMGQDHINHWLVVSAYNDGFTNGVVRGSSQVFYTIFEDYIKEHPYKLDNYGNLK